jgi:hypothetical protein
MSETVSSSMLQKFKDFLTGRKSGEITPADAEKIQKADYALAHTEVKKKYSPTYLSILSGLESEEKQLFEATVYYLVQIAANKPKYHDEIIEILENKAAENTIKPAHWEYIQQQLQNISLKNNL